MLFNICNPECGLDPLTVTFAKVQKGCAICDPSKIDNLTVEQDISIADTNGDVSKVYFS